MRRPPSSFLLFNSSHNRDTPKSLKGTLAPSAGCVDLSSHNLVYIPVFFFLILFLCFLTLKLLVTKLFPLGNSSLAACSEECWFNEVVEENGSKMVISIFCAIWGQEMILAI